MPGIESSPWRSALAVTPAALLLMPLFFFMVRFAQVYVAFDRPIPMRIIMNGIASARSPSSSYTRSLPSLEPHSAIIQTTGAEPHRK